MELVSVITLTGVILTFAINLFQSIRSQHFTSDCMGAKITYDVKNKS